jgi:hypothetical protein
MKVAQIFLLCFNKERFNRPRKGGDVEKYNGYYPAFWKDDWFDTHQYDLYNAMCGGNCEDGERRWKSDLQGKARYKTEEMARRAAREYFRDENRSHLQITGENLRRKISYPHVYECWFCGYWHFGHNHQQYWDRRFFKK